ncbi:hypothetical protein [Streptomyces albogriseolus]|uniref:hypothetical protein n=1 Tax=Streptomyces albogriseolus TaxID=1887 RepID=UPI003F4A608F
MQADLHLCGQDTPSNLAAINDLRRSLTGTTLLPKQYPGTDKHARSRARRAFLAALDNTELVTPAIWTPRRSSFEGDHAFHLMVSEAFALRAQDDPHTVRLLENAEQALRSAKGRVEKDDLIRYWYLRSRVWAGDEDIRAVRAAAHVEDLAGAGSPLTVIARDDAAMACEKHGYLDAAARHLSRALKEVPLLDVSPQRKVMETARIVTRQLALDAHCLISRPHLGDHEQVLERIRALLRFLDRHAGQDVDIYRTVAYRRITQVHASLALRDRTHEGYRKGLALPHRIQSLMNQGDMISESMGPEGWRLSWYATRVGIALEADWPDEFEEYAAKIAAIVSRSSELHENLIFRYRRMVSAAQAKKTLSWRRIAVPEVIPRTPLLVAANSRTLPSLHVRTQRPDFL